MPTSKDRAARVWMLKMETMFFESFDPSAETNRVFLRDLTTLLELSDGITASVEKEHLNAQRKVGGMRQNEKQALASKLGIPLTKLSSCLDVIEFITRRLSRKAYQDDTADGLAKDLVEVAPDANLNKHDLVKLFANLKDKIVPEYKEIRKKKLDSVSVLPRLRAVHTSCELCPIAEHEFELGDSVKDYDPEISGYVPVISVKLLSSSENLKEFIFQASPEALEYIIEHLKAALINAKAFEKFIKNT